MISKVFNTQETREISSGIHIKSNAYSRESGLTITNNLKSIQTTLSGMKMNSNFSLLAFIPSRNKFNGSICINGHSQAKTHKNYDILVIYSTLIYKYYTSNIKTENLKCI